MAWGQEFEKQFFGGQGLKDYAHASKTFRTNGYELAPRNKFLFHCFFNMNTDMIPSLGKTYTSTEQASIGLLVKTIQLPKFTIETEILNQYNRKRVIQKKINYGSVQTTFHDDGGDLIRNMWYNYYSYYYKDPNQAYVMPAQNGSMGQSQSLPGFAYNARDIYANDRVVNDWGYVGESYNQGNAGSGGVGSGGDQSSGKPAFFKDITIYGMDQHKWVSYVLINPLIKSWDHDTYNYSEGSGTMQNSMTIDYETVKYYAGVVGRDRPDPKTGFADPSHYDQTLSPISRPGSRATFMGQGGLLDAAGGIIEDLSSGGPLGAIGAVQKAGTAYNTFKNKNLKSIAVAETVALGTSVIKGTAIPQAMRQVPGRSSGMYYPVPTTQQVRLPGT
jgi:hypothetical protein